MAYDVLLYGAGQIASGYDSPHDSTVLTHAHAICEDSRYKLLGFYDIDPKKSKHAAQKWGGEAYAQPVAADIAVICTPDFMHVESVRQAVAQNPKLIVLEKPISDTLTGVQAIQEITQGIPVTVNYSRRFVPEFHELACQIRGYGQYLTGTGYYGKGFLHNGSHMIDLLGLLIGAISEISTHGAIYDFVPNDPTKCACIEFETGGKFFLHGIDCNHYTIFEAEFYFEHARVCILDSGNKVQVYRPSKSEQYAGYSYLQLSEEFYPNMSGAIKNLYANIYDFLNGRSPLLSDLSGAYVKELYK